MYIRKHIVKECALLNIDLLKDGIFDSAVVPTMIMQLRNQCSNKSIIRCSQGGLHNYYSIKQDFFLKTDLNVFNLDLNDETAIFLELVTKDTIPLKEVAKVSNAINTGNMLAYLYDKPAKGLIKVLKGASIHKWNYQHMGLYLNPSFEEFVSVGDIAVMNSPKLMMKRIGVYPEVCYDDTGIAAFHTVHTIRIIDKQYSPFYILALLNSRLIGKIFRLRVPLKGDVFPEFRVFDLNKQIPIKRLSSKEQKPLVEIAKLICEKASLGLDVSDNEEDLNLLVDKTYGL